MVVNSVLGIMFKNDRLDLQNTIFSFPLNNNGLLITNMLNTFLLYLVLQMGVTLVLCEDNHYLDHNQMWDLKV